LDLTEAIDVVLPFRSDQPGRPAYTSFLLAQIGHRTRPLVFCLLLTACLFVESAWAANDSSNQFLGHTVASVLAQFEKTGEGFIYSSDVLPPEARFPVEPPPGPDIERLRAALASLNVELRPAGKAAVGASHRWLIVPLRTSRRRQRSRGCQGPV
jgi:hypothetical protein